MSVIVLKTSGRLDDVDTVTVHFFENEEKAKKFCEENTDKHPEKYWQYCDIIKEGTEYYVMRYRNEPVNS